tara:strand:+ start:528 stop:1388 length:861 start_codon:yes stop_codon:yes gene_type:complete
MKLKSSLFAGFGIMFLVMVLLVYISFQNSNTLIEDTNWVIHTQKVIGDLNKILALLIDAETGQRGFLITTEDRYLEPYNNAVDIIDKNIVELKGLTSDNSVQQANIYKLESLVDDKFAELKETISIRKNNPNGLEEARKIVLSDKGKNIMDEIRVLIDDMKSEEETLLKIRSQAPEEGKSITNLLLLILLGIGLIVSTIVIYLLHNEISKPLNNLTNAIDEVSKGNFNVEISKDVGKINEVNILTESLSRIIVSMKLAVDDTESKRKKSKNELEKPGKKMSKSKKK